MPVTNYLWDVESDNVLMEYDENGVTQAVNTQEPGEFGELISQRRNGATSYHHYDATGSTRSLTDEAGNTTDTYDYSGFGETIAKTGTTTSSKSRSSIVATGTCSTANCPTYRALWSGARSPNWASLPSALPSRSMWAILTRESRPSHCLTCSAARFSLALQPTSPLSPA